MQKSVLITGADKGLGFAFAMETLKKGYVAYACLYMPVSGRMQALKKEYGDRLRIIEDVDVGDDGSVEKAVKAVGSYTDSLDILVNNAAVLHPDNFYGKLEGFDFKVALDTFNINALGPLRMTKGFLDFIARGDTKVIVNISSEAGSVSGNFRDFGYDYCMSKTAVNMQSAILQKYLKPRGIKILAVHPGWMRTDMGGANADFDPETSAQNILDLAEKYSGRLDDGIYMDNRGKRMDW